MLGKQAIPFEDVNSSLQLLLVVILTCNTLLEYQYFMPVILSFADGGLSFMLG